MFLPNESFFTQTISHWTEAATRGVLLFLEISQNSQENTSARVSLFFNTFAGLRSATLLKKRLWRRCFPVHFVKFLKTRFVQNTSGQLLLNQIILYITTENSEENIWHIYR